MSSARQIAANRRNAQKCTGPKTEAGKAASRFNGLKHGLTAATVVLPYEDQIEYQELRARVLEDFTPENALEWMLVDQLTSAWWRTIRARKVESALMEAHKKTLHWRHEVRPSRNEAENFEALGVAMASHEEATFINYNRYDSAIERAFYRAADRIQKIVDKRKRDVARSVAAPALYKTASAGASEMPSVESEPRAEASRPSSKTLPVPVCPKLGLVSSRDVAHAAVVSTACKESPDSKQSPPPHTMAA